MEVTNAIGRRKAAVARVYVTPGKGTITINKRDLAVYFPSSILQFVVKQPLVKLGVAENYDIKVNLNGGTLINGIKEAGERYLYTLNNSRLLNEIDSIINEAIIYSNESKRRNNNGSP